MNSAVKSMCSITATPDDIVRHRPMSYDVVLSVNTAAKDMWAAVQQLTGRQRRPVVPDGVDADCLNKHYANISTERAYVKPPLKLTAVKEIEWSCDRLDECRMFGILDTPKVTASGLDGLPA